MKKYLLTAIAIAAIAMANLQSARAQSIADLLEELSLDYQKLAGMKSTLNQMYSGYSALTRGYNAVKSVSMDNFSLNKAFLDAQLLVSPGVRAYPRTADVMRNASSIAAECGAASRDRNGSKGLSPAERSFVSRVFDRIIEASSANLDELNRVTTDNQVRMTDAERMAAIDRLYRVSENQLSYLRKFNEQIAKLIRQRQNADANRQMLRSLYR